MEMEKYNFRRPHTLPVTLVRRIAQCATEGAQIMKGAPMWRVEDLPVQRIAEHDSLPETVNQVQ
jgi:hypothetical protein